MVGVGTAIAAEYGGMCRKTNGRAVRGGKISRLRFAPPEMTVAQHNGESNLDSPLYFLGETLAVGTIVSAALTDDGFDDGCAAAITGLARATDDA